MRISLEDRTTAQVNTWSVFTDLVLAMLLLLVFVIFVQFIGNSRAFVQLMIAGQQAQMSALLEKHLKDDYHYLTTVTDGNLQRLRFSSSVLFDSASSRLKSSGQRMLSRVGQALLEGKEQYQAILIEGHTDDVAIGNAAFASNWELSSARATAVVRYLEQSVKMDPKVFRIAAVGRSEYVPASKSIDFKAAKPAQIKQWRELNRRIEVVLVYSEKDFLPE